jgi:hypothetical protein
VANTDGLLRLIGRDIRTVANSRGRLRVVHEWSMQLEHP